jgi:hypothetical protein
MARHYDGRIVWVPAQIDELSELWKLGWTSGQIGTKMGFSRSSIIGKAQRLGLTKSHPHPKCVPHDSRLGGRKVGGPSVGAALATSKINRGEPRKVTLAMVSSAEKVSPMPQRPFPTPAPVVHKRRGPTPFLFSLPSQCHRPLWGPGNVPLDEKMICGNPVVAGSSYCEECLPLMSQPVPGRKRA